MSGVNLHDPEGIAKLIKATSARLGSLAAPGSRAERHGPRRGQWDGPVSRERCPVSGRFGAFFTLQTQGWLSQVAEGSAMGSRECVCVCTCEGVSVRVCMRVCMCECVYVRECECMHLCMSV